MLDVPEEILRKISEGTRLFLCDSEGIIIAEMRIDEGNVLNCVHIWSPPRLQEVFPFLRTIAAVIYPASEWKVIGLPGLDEVPRASS